MKRNERPLYFLLGVLISILVFSTLSIHVFNVGALTKNMNSKVTLSQSLTEIELVSKGSVNSSFVPSIGADTNGNVHVVWWDSITYDGDGSNTEIYYSYKGNTVSWSTPVIISTDGVIGSKRPSLAVDSEGNVHVTWTDAADYNGAGSDSDIFYKFKASSSSTWTNTEIVSTESNRSSLSPSLAVDTAGNVHIAWLDYTDYDGCGDDGNIFYKYLNVTQSSWSEVDVLSSESVGRAYPPDLAVDSEGNVHVTWHDWSDYAGSGPDTDIFYSFMNITTSLWSIAELISTDNTAASYNPNIAIDSANNVHIVWQDFTDINPCGNEGKIFYKRRNSTNMLWSEREFISPCSSTIVSYYPCLVADYVGNVHLTWTEHAEYPTSEMELGVVYTFWNSSTATWSAIKSVSKEDSQSARTSAITVDPNGNLHIAWEDDSNDLNSDDDQDIFYRSLVINSVEENSKVNLVFIIPGLLIISLVYSKTHKKAKRERE